MANTPLRHELNELTLVAAGAIPGALLRWQLEGLMIGLLLSKPDNPKRLLLWGAIGFCGSLTTFSSWMLELVRALDRGAPLAALQVLLASLVGGLLLLSLGRALGERWFKPRHRRSS